MAHEILEIRQHGGDALAQPPREEVLVQPCAPFDLQHLLQIDSIYAGDDPEHRDDGEAPKLAEELRTKQREAFQGLQNVPQDERGAKMAEVTKSINSDTDKGLADILKPEQVKRFGHRSSIP